MDKNVGSFRMSRRDESTLGAAFFKIDIISNSIPSLDFTEYSTNCDRNFLKRTNQTPVFGTCLPETEIRGIWKQKFKNVEYPENPVEIVNVLSSKIKDMGTLALLNPVGNYNLDMYYKPPMLTTASASVDYRDAIPKNKGFELVENNSRSLDLDSDMQEYAWMKMSEIERVMIARTTGSNCAYIGFLHCDPSFSIQCQVNKLMEESFCDRIRDALKNPEVLYLTWICRNQGHWTSLVYSKQLHIAFYFDSQINNFTKITKRPKMAIYSYDTCSLLKYGTPGDKGMYVKDTEQLPIDISYKILEKLDFKFTLFIANKETAQLQSAECGMYSLLFVHLLLEQTKIHQVTAQDLCKTYHFFKYCGDNTVREYRNLFYNPLPFSLTEMKLDMSNFEKMDKMAIQTLSKLLSTIKGKTPETS